MPLNQTESILKKFSRDRHSLTELFDYPSRFFRNNCYLKHSVSEKENVSSSDEAFTFGPVGEILNIDHLMRVISFSVTRILTMLLVIKFFET